uniref:Anaphase-promoting complex subunit 4 WD40 domain-containing protein n=1 Tax=Leptocylindrus danicus TaxID=163516 RepID=A0A7S2KZ84_9STRA|mmetsp:Transcript_28436/g.41856  ORF Transcript_28436/g.41856 Transcript_28436/m.41856 type:complete len:579 (+) Transcript_28436:115-1851(+)|eukprot:CAMPEP_0116017164 /NCGR_PEP_ID=MMETSP0321-20121206/7892_1 /TAXON_ID=163516 /ORGANISM="Leptocylindrus danicus var. danicus, Strain B650" /LENGTH=578 /DNA_ID=CAMNT_0003487319 /DNA_START=37 /DNA_END=1773 /DNA_ORIENTATION=-
MVISSLAWIPAGCADPNPKRYQLTQEEIQKLQALGENANDDEDEDDDVPPDDDDDLPADLRMDEYDDSSGDERNIGDLLVKYDDVEDDDIDHDDSDSSMDDDDEGAETAANDDPREFMPSDVDGLMSMGMANMEGDYKDDDSLGSDVEDTNLLEDDCLVLVGKAEEDFATLEVMLYAPKQGNLYVHHDIPLPAFPLALAHGDIGPLGTAGNFCAVGTFDCGIEIWDLDILDVLEPVCTLGGMDTRAEEELIQINMARAAAGKKLKKKKNQNTKNNQPNKLKDGSHTDAVMALSWNKVHRQVIASGSADGTVKLWDITSDSTAPASTFTHHRDKVQSVAWHPTEGTILATGSFDRSVCLIDARTAGNSKNNTKSQRIPADCESLAWDPFREQNLTCASEDGTLTCWDVRKFDGGEPLWSFIAHEFGVSEVSYNPNVRGLMATSSVDQTVSLWDAHTIDSSGRIKACGSKDVKVGKLYSVSFYPSKQQPWLLTAAGGGTEISIWDLTREKMIRDAFQGRLANGSYIDDSVNDENEVSTEKDFEAMMAAEEKNKSVQKSNDSSAKKGKKKKGKAKKKVHKR